MDLSNPLLRSFDKVKTATYNFVSLIVKRIFSESLSLTLSLPAGSKTEYFDHSSFNSTFQLITGISSDLQISNCRNF